MPDPSSARKRVSRALCRQAFDDSRGRRARVERRNACTVNPFRSTKIPHPLANMSGVGFEKGQLWARKPGGIGNAPPPHPRHRSGTEPSKFVYHAGPTNTNGFPAAIHQVVELVESPCGNTPPSLRPFPFWK